MDPSKNSYKILNSIFPFADFLYILQLEEYFSINYLNSAARFFLRRNIQKRDTLKWTSRIQTTFTISLIFYIFTIIIAVLFGFGTLGIILGIFLIPIYVFLANLILTPFYNAIKTRICSKATNFMQTNSSAKVIGIAGSFGKTTTKNLIYQFIRSNYKTQVIPGNLNTPVGIANWLLANFDKNSEYLIVEMDAFVPNAIKNICKITPPDIAILTNIGDQHLTRFKSKSELARASKEIFTYSKANSLHITQDDIKDAKPYKNFSASVNQCIALAKLVAQELEIPNEFIEDSIDKFELPDRRQKLTKLHGFDIVDDSYNISLTTAKAGIDASVNYAKSFKKNLLVITAGIPESDDHKKTNHDLGQYLSKNADFVVVLNSIFSNYIIKNTDKKHVIKNDLNEAWSYIKENFDPKDTFILLQPELTDLYY